MSRTMLLSLFVLALSQLQAAAQTLQLPTFHEFGYSGTVEVPDRGTMSLGGNSYSASGRSHFPEAVISHHQGALEKTCEEYRFTYCSWL